MQSGQIVPGSNAVDLVKEALVASRAKMGHSWEPTGWNKFLNTLRESNVPKSLFGKKKPISIASSAALSDPYHGSVPEWLTLK